MVRDRGAVSRVWTTGPGWTGSPCARWSRCPSPQDEHEPGPASKTVVRPSHLRIRHAGHDLPLVESIMTRRLAAADEQTVDSACRWPSRWFLSRCNGPVRLTACVATSITSTESLSSMSTRCVRSQDRPRRSPRRRRAGNRLLTTFPLRDRTLWRSARCDLMLRISFCSSVVDDRVGIDAGVDFRNRLHLPRTTTPTLSAAVRGEGTPESGRYQDTVYAGSIRDSDRRRCWWPCRSRPLLFRGETYSVSTRCIGEEVPNWFVADGISSIFV